MLAVYFPFYNVYLRYLQNNVLAILFIFLCVFVYIVFQYITNDLNTEKSSDKIQTKTTTRRASTVLQVNRLPYKQNISIGNTNVPETFAQRRLMRRPEVTRYLENRRQSRRPSVTEKQTAFGSHGNCLKSRRDSTTVTSLSLNNATNRRFSIACKQQINTDLTLHTRPVNLQNLRKIDVSNDKISNKEEHSNSKFLSRHPFTSRTTLSTIQEVEEPPEIITNPNPVEVMNIPRRMSITRRQSIKSLQRRQSRRASFLKHSIPEIPGIPTKSDSQANQRSRRSRTIHSARSMIVPRRRERGITGDLAEFKSVFSSTAHEVLMKRYKEFGPLYQFQVLGQTMVFLFDHKDIEHLKKAEGRCPQHIDFKHLRVYREKNGYPLGLLVSHGEEWKEQRKTLSKLLVSTVSLVKYISAINEVAHDAVTSIPTDHYNAFKPESFVGNYAIEAFGRVLYGQNMGCLNTHKRNNMHKFVEISRSNFEDAKKLLIIPAWIMPLHPAWKRHNQRWNFLLDVTMANIEMYGNRGLKYKNPCLLSQLLQDDTVDKGQLFINFTDLLVASIDTTANVLQWCLYELGRHAHIQEKIYIEIKELLETYDNVIQDVLQNAVLLKAVVKETLRLHPVGFFTSRIIEKDMYVRNYKIPAKTHVAVSMYTMGRNPELFPDPEEFRPERWLSNNIELERFYNDVPFGFGPRMCIGRRIAELKIVSYIMHFCLHFTFESTVNNIEPTIRMLMVPNKTVTLRLTQRGETEYNDTERSYRTKQ